MINQADYAQYASANDGQFKVPTLRNVDKRPYPMFIKAYGHNGYFKSLEGIVHFYNSRDVLPRCQDNSTKEIDALAQNCWPVAEVTANLNTQQVGNLQLSDQEEHEIVAFIKTLTDGYKVRNFYEEADSQ